MDPVWTSYVFKVEVPLLLWKVSITLGEMAGLLILEVQSIKMLTLTPLRRG